MPLPPRAAEGLSPKSPGLVRRTPSPACGGRLGWGRAAAKHLPPPPHTACAREGAHMCRYLCLQGEGFGCSSAGSRLQSVPDCHSRESGNPISAHHRLDARRSLPSNALIGGESNLCIEHVESPYGFPLARERQTILVPAPRLKHSRGWGTRSVPRHPPGACLPRPRRRQVR